MKKLIKYDLGSLRTGKDTKACEGSLPVVWLMPGICVGKN